MIRKILPYDSKLNALARKLRNDSTFTEVKLWKSLRSRQMMGYGFHRQKPVKNFIIDFYCKELRLAIEVDGITHIEKNALQKELARQKELEELGITFLRFTSNEVYR